MKRIVSILGLGSGAAALLALALMASGLPTPSTASADDQAAAKLFQDKKCNRCHTVKVAGIAKMEAEGEDKEVDLEEKKKVEPPDLSGVGVKRDADYLTQWMQRRVANDDGRKHKKKFTGKDDELATLVSWMVTLKSPQEPAAPAAPAEEKK
ncbi:MAG: c-type cytochrome [Candidatus Schekmanbacteria bacterium]|nr:c-type cytochrome [Candidatus Schekmanbacteria bacterium]